MDSTIEIALSLPKPPSLNAFYSGRHWTIRKKHKEVYKESLVEAFGSYDDFTAEQYEINVEYNARYDVDNSIMCAKFVSDYLKDYGYVVDDTPKYFIKQSTKFNKSLKKNEFLCRIKLYGYQLRE
jgi:hypothetical protein